MRHLIICLLPLLLGCGLFGGGGEGPELEDVPAGLEGITLPPVNAPLRLEAEPIERVVQPVLPTTGAALLLLREEAPLVGAVELGGTLKLSATELSIAPTDGSPVVLRYRLPEGLSRPTWAPIDARARILERSGPQGADRVAVVHGEEGLTFAEVWQRSAEPVRAELEGGIVLQQKAATAGTGFLPSAVSLIDHTGEPRNIPIGESTTVQTPWGAVEVHVEASYLHSIEDDGHGGGEYMLHAWVTGHER